MDPRKSEEEALSRYRGRDVSDLVLYWGPSESTVKRPEGTIYTFRESSQQIASAPSTTFGTFGARPIFATTDTPLAITSSCRVNAYTDHENRIVALRHSGARAACVDMYALLPVQP